MGAEHLENINRNGRATTIWGGPLIGGERRAITPAALRFRDDLDFERFGTRATLAHGNPSDKGDRVRLKIHGLHRP